MNKPSISQIVALAVAGISAGLVGCGGNNAPADSAAGQEPSGEKHGCKKDAEGKHICGAEVKKEDMDKAAPTTPPAESGPAEKAAP